MYSNPIIFYFFFEPLLLVRNKCYFSTKNMHAVISRYNYVCSSSVCSEGSALQPIFTVKVVLEVEKVIWLFSIHIALKLNKESQFKSKSTLQFMKSSCSRLKCT